MGVHVVSLHDKVEIEAFVRRNPLRHLFELGDLDERYWPHTVWYALEGVDTSAVTPLTQADVPALEALYRESYPGNAFSSQSVWTGWYYGIRDEDTIVSVAGVHLFSPSYRVAVLGNVATLPRVRGRGLASALCARLCSALLLQGVEHIGLFVKADNLSAIGLYGRLGFETVGEVGAYTLESSRTP